jgi:hypothetical protein
MIRLRDLGAALLLIAGTVLVSQILAAIARHLAALLH